MNNEMKPSEKVIFITGRFRSGTSFLWQLFNRLDGYCAWYEPLHPQLPSAIKHVEPKADHVGIDDYWQTYRKHPEFELSYSMQFATQKLYLEAYDDYPALAAYIDKLIELSGADTPVLQFNRVDFRLSWLKAKFPQAKIVHIERNPLQLYHSQRKHIENQQRDNAQYWDAYELLPWCHALQQQFPFLVDHHKHAFYSFYAIYQLSQMIAEQCADVSINLDVQVFQGTEFIELLSSVADFTPAQKAQIKAMRKIPEMPEFDQSLTDELSAIMTEVDLVLASSGLLEEFGLWPLSDIKKKYSSFWQAQGVESKSTENLLLNINQLNSELTRILAENSEIKKQMQQQQAKFDSLKHQSEQDCDASDEGSGKKIKLKNYGKKIT